MKILLIIVFVVLFCNPVFSENEAEKFSINLNLSFPLLKSDIPQLRLFPDAGIEALYHFAIFKGVSLGTGLGFEGGHHIWNKEYASVKVVDGQLRKYQGVYTYHFEFYSFEIPLNFKIPVGARFINAFNIGFDFGWHFKTDFYLERATLQTEPELNKLYLSGQAGMQIPLFKLKRLPVNVQPFLKYRNYLTEKNDYQANYYLIGIKLNTNF